MGMVLLVALHLSYIEIPWNDESMLFCLVFFDLTVIIVNFI